MKILGYVLLILNVKFYWKCLCVENEPQFMPLGSPSPVIKVHELNYAGEIVQTFYDSSDVRFENSRVQLPRLTVEENIWGGKSFVVNCSAPYPVRWEYDGPGVSFKV